MVGATGRFPTPPTGEPPVRVVDEVPTQLVVADGSPALVPLTVRSAEPAAPVVHPGGLL